MRFEQYPLLLAILFVLTTIPPSAIRKIIVRVGSSQKKAQFIRLGIAPARIAKVRHNRQLVALRTLPVGRFNVYNCKLIIS